MLPLLLVREYDQPFDGSLALNLRIPPAGISSSFFPSLLASAISYRRIKRETPTGAHLNEKLLNFRAVAAAAAAAATTEI